MNVPDSVESRLARLQEQIRGVREDIEEMRTAAKDDHHRLRGVESAVQQMIDAQKAARQSEANQYKRVANAIQFGGLAMSLAVVALTIVTIVLQH